jgi:hypothetical protein
LSGCDRRDRCDCRYRHHEDRRSKLDRRDSSASGIRQLGAADRRKQIGRRAEDGLDDPTATEAQIDLDDTYYGFRRR